MTTDYMKIVKSRLFVVVLAVLAAATVLAWLMAEPKVEVKIYKSLETGNFIYCRTGELTGDQHEYIGEGKIAESKAVEC